MGIAPAVIVRPISLSYPRTLTIVWGLWALLKGLSMDPPEGFFHEVDKLTPIPLSSVWVITGIVLLVGATPGRLVPPGAWNCLMWFRMVGINLLAALVSVWLSASLLDASLDAVSTNVLIISLALISAHAIAREGKTVRGDTRGDPH